MHSKKQVFLVDVFTDQAYSGNPLAVVVNPEGLSDHGMQQVASEINFSETTFVDDAPNDAGEHRVRIFTPSKEIAFAGHPILGTAWILRKHFSTTPCNEMNLQLQVGNVQVTFEKFEKGKEIAWFRAPQMTLGETIDRESIAPALGLSESDISPDTPVQVVSSGTSAIIVPVASSDALQQSQLNLEAFSGLANKGFPPLVYLYCNQTVHPENDLSVRFFFEAHGVREDPATGNGAAFLGEYLFAHQYQSKSAFTLRVEQGYNLRRPSLIFLNGNRSKDSQQIEIGGYVVETMRGELV